MAAVIAVESGGNPYAIHDNTTAVSYAPPTLGEAIGIGELLVDRGHSVDLGIAQINSGNMAHYRIGVASLFNPCVNVNVGARILRDAWRSAIGRYGSAPEVRPRVVFAAAQGYNSGSLFGAPRYASAVVNAYYSSSVQEVVALSYHQIPESRTSVRTREIEHSSPRASPRILEKKKHSPSNASAFDSFSGVWQRGQRMIK